VHNVNHDGLLVLLRFLIDEFILHSRTNVSKGESIVKPQDFELLETSKSWQNEEPRRLVLSKTGRGPCRSALP